MVTIERRLAGVLRYRKIWLPGRDAAIEVARSLRFNDVVRLFAAPDHLDDLPRLARKREMRTAWIDLSGSPAAILNGMKKKSCRYEIRRAEKMLDQVAIEVSTTQARHDFLRIYNDFARVKHLPRLTVSHLHEYTPHADTFLIYRSGEPLCSHLLLRDSESGTVRLLYSASRRLHTPEDGAICGALNRYLHWQEMLHYQRQGFVTFDFGGIRSPEDPISRFKLSFGGRIVTESYYVLGGVVWLAKLGSRVYEKIFRRPASRPNDIGETQRAVSEGSPSVSGFRTNVSD
jgi:hypothetical protein